MDEKNGKNPLLAITVATVLFAALGVVYYIQTPYKGERPSVPEIHEPSEMIRARLWQDPFQAVLDHVKAKEPLGEKSKGPPRQDDSKKKGKKSQASPKPTDYDPIFAGVIDFGQPLQKPLKKTLKQGLGQDIAAKQPEIDENFRTRLKDENITILAVMVWGGAYAELIESRLRQRYAVLAALNRLGYYPDDPEHIGALRIVHIGQGQEAPSAHDQGLTLANIIPFEWLLSDHKKQILLLWLNEDSFKNTPLKKIFLLRKQVREKEQQRFLLIGPPSSSTLADMIKELPNTALDRAGLEIYCATATADDPFLLPDYQKGTKKISEQRKEARQIIEDRFRKKRITFTRNICSDGELLEALADELRRRRVNLINPDDYVVMVSEWDTLYGRSLPETMKNIIRERHKGKLGEKIRWVQRFSYLRGIDGKLPGEQNGSDKDQKKNEAGKKEEIELQKLEQPLGKSQYDYLRRLSESISRLDASLKEKEKSPWREPRVKAIGVLGNDFYDKFLVLQALGQRLPDRIFFTTDLEARYLHPAYNDWTRNLVVASTYDLQLRKDLQRDVPPFRDAYQTATFAATLRAFKCPDLKETDFKELKPRIFEIGRRNAIDLTDRPDKNGPINQAPLPATGLPSLTKSTPLLIVIIIFLFILFKLYIPLSLKSIVKGVWNMFQKTGQAITKNLDIAFVILFLFILLVLFYSAEILDLWKMGINIYEEPFYLAEGVSIWPTILIRLIVIILSLVFLILSLIGLGNNYKDLLRDFYVCGYPEEVSNPWRQNISDWWKKRKNQLYDIWIFISNLQDKIKSYIKDITSSEIGRENEISVEYLWKRYIHEGKFPYRFGRTILLSILYMIICFQIIAMWGLPFSPVRGEKIIFWNKILLKLTIFIFTLLTFFVFDAIRILRRFVTAFYGKDPQWEEKSLSQFGWQAGMSKEALGDWMLIRLVAKRTEAVGKLIYYPFIVWFMLVLSRLHYFDNWRTPVGLAIVISLSALIACSSAFLLRRSAEGLRADLINRLEKKLITVLSAESLGKDKPENKRSEYIQKVIEEIKSIRRGAFAPVLQQPALQSFLGAFLSIGGLNFFEFVK